MILALKVKQHEDVAPGSFSIEVRCDFEHEWPVPIPSYRIYMAQIDDWCRASWGQPVAEVFHEARWMIVGARVYVREQQQALELRLRWHGLRARDFA